ncbi:hypothetical protein CEXT_204501 [Caerostris extrusa]|uniref:Uncharacterized protein n=1 Tax=Caerostris extrusa TaxID=172846 RepID=A0AAV4P9S7_CAEEX|nr:hypothetical protein CEXT_204501 [Caerostris extrusa]
MTSNEKPWIKLASPENAKLFHHSYFGKDPYHVLETFYVANIIGDKMKGQKDVGHHCCLHEKHLEENKDIGHRCCLHEKQLEESMITSCAGERAPFADYIIRERKVQDLHSTLKERRWGVEIEFRLAMFIRLRHAFCPVVAICDAYR